MRDRASVNGIAMRTLKIVFPDAIDIGCYSHIIDLVGDKFCTPNLDNFVFGYPSLHIAPVLRLWWKARTGKAMSSYCPTRWWSKWEVMSQVMAFFADIAPFLEANPELSPATSQKLLNMLHTPAVKAPLQAELAVVVDAGEALVKATYNLEGDGPLILRCYKILSSLFSSIELHHYPNIDAIAQMLSGGSNQTFQQWVDYAFTCVRPGLQYFKDKFSEEMRGSVEAFKAARLFLPQKVVELRPDVVAVDSLKAFPFLNKPAVLFNLKSELPNYLA